MATEKDGPFRLPPPKFSDETKKSLDSFTKLRNPHFSTPSGMLLPRDKQPPPMYGPRGSTVPPRFMTHHQPQKHYRRGTDRGSYQYRFLKDPRHGHQNQYFDKDIIPELLELDWTLWCEGCDANCKTDDEYRRHFEEHRNCDVPGCQYVGHPKAMKRHWRLAHDEEKRLEKAQMQTKQSPEEIASWCEERRKRFPTKENVKMRQKAQEERFKRGERIEENKSRFPDRNQPDREHPPFHMRRGWGRFGPGNRRSRNKNKTVPEKIQDSNDEDGLNRVGFKGTSKMKDYKPKPVTALSLLGVYGSDSEDESGEDSESEEDESPVMPEQSVKLVEERAMPHNPESMHISDEEVVDRKDSLSEGEIESSDSEHDEGKETPTNNPESIHITDNEDEQKNSLSEGELESSSSEHEEEKAESNDQQAVVESKPNKPEQVGSKRRHRSRRRRRAASPEQLSDGPTDPKVIRIEQPILDYRKLRRTRENTLLEKLLEPDIRHERNVLLQCVRFVVANNFFGIGQPKPEEPSRTVQ
ncbi:FMR1-interacting protein NUFIP1 [Topomyia yanbarensis]|uniref:FMR1-interacting protein NUFIP1 n=1 Tax=Topomyia yanbarensis TaxID=2498891 RepID=UPI00273B412D|nr:FMR1-interacting protein NUFIP1 [Topomyia yanbarensis]